MKEKIIETDVALEKLNIIKLHIKDRIEVLNLEIGICEKTLEKFPDSKMTKKRILGLQGCMAELVLLNDVLGSESKKNKRIKRPHCQTRTLEKAKKYISESKGLGY